MFRRLINKLEWQILSGSALTDLDSKEQIPFLTDYVKNLEISAGMRRETQENFYTGSLIKSYVQFTLLQGGIH